MPPTIHCVRHAQGFHNLSIANHALHDPRLTPLGEEQCRHLQADFPYHKDVDLVVASPLKRTINTALLSFEHDIKTKGLKVIGLPELQETSDLPCDTGSSPEELKKEFHGKPVDLHLVKHGWDSKQGKFAPSTDAIKARARDARKWLMSRPEKNIVVVTHGMHVPYSYTPLTFRCCKDFPCCFGNTTLHKLTSILGGFLHFFTEDWSGAEKYSGTGWANTEYRSYTFSPNHPEDAHVVETAASKHRREVKGLDHNEHEQLKRTVSKEAAEQASEEANRATKIQAKVCRTA